MSLHSTRYYVRHQQHAHPVPLPFQLCSLEKDQVLLVTLEVSGHVQGSDGALFEGRQVVLDEFDVKTVVVRDAGIIHGQRSYKWSGQHYQDLSLVIVQLAEIVGSPDQKVSESFAQHLYHLGIHLDLNRFSKNYNITAKRYGREKKTFCWYVKCN